MSLRLADLYRTWPGRVDSSGQWTSRTHLTSDGQRTLCGLDCSGGFWSSRGVELDGRFIEPDDEAEAAERIGEVADCKRCLKAFSAHRRET